MNDGMPYDPIQGQGHETFEVRNSSIFFNFQSLSPPTFLMWAGKWPLILKILYGPDFRYLTWILCHVTTNLEQNLDW